MIKAGIIGATGYTGIELIRLLQQHPQTEITAIVTNTYAEQEITDVYPHLKNHVAITGDKLDLENLIAHCDVLFLALPHGHAIEIVPKLLTAGKKVIDLGADFRLKKASAYQQWYQQTPATEELLTQAVYGLTEKGDKEQIMRANLIANPGCYPTACLLATLPALKAGIIDKQTIIFDAKSGISGAGRTPNLRSLYCEISENLTPYQIAGLHRHTPEIEQELSFAAQQDIIIQFTPHLVPMIRGLVATAYFKLLHPLTTQEVTAIYKEAYENEYFIRIQENLPQTKNVRGTNYCDLNIQVDPRTQRLIVVSAIDNLIKGASGQAIQNMNLMYQLPEAMGLNHYCAVYP